MRNFTFLLFALLFSCVGYSQFPTPGTEGFESTTGPDLPIPVAASPWTLGTGVTGNQWAVFDNGVPAPSATQKRWTYSSSIFNSGSQSAFINRKQNGAAGNISEDYLVTPRVTVPANGQLTFWTRVGFNSPDTVNYLIKVNTISGTQTTLANYTTIQTWDQTNIADPSNITTWVQKTVDLSAYPAGTNLYLAFVRVFNQPTSALGGNSWYVDDVKLVQRCIEPTNQTASNFTTTTANLSWTPNGSTSWEVEVIPVVGGTQTGVGTIFSGSLPYTATGLNPGTCYVYYVRAKCAESDSNWVGPFNFCTLTPGLTCNAPITVTPLPYSTTDNTSNYADTYDTAQPTACTGSATNYMQGNDVFYSYTPTTTGAISITMTPGGATATNSGIFVYQGCSNVGVTCLAGVANATSGVRTIPSLNVTAGQTYIIVLSSTSTTQTYPYSLLIQQLNCPPPTISPVTSITSTGATLNWTTPTSTSWEYVIQPLGGTVPTGSGITSTTNATPVTEMSPGVPLNCDTQYQFWVRAACGNGTFSPWSGPQAFTTAVCVPGCGTLFTDPGGQFANYTNGLNVTYPIVPSPGNQVTVTFTAFNTQAGNDILKVYDGNGITGTLLGTYSGTTLPPTITSSSPDGALTFVFTSNASTVSTGWIANVTCNPAPGCQKPILLTAPTATVTYNSVSVGWTQTANPDTTIPSQWEIIALPCTSPAPTDTTTGGILVTSNPYTYSTGLSPLTCYNFYVRAVCSGTSFSSWSTPVSATTLVAPAICGGNFVDPGGPTGNYPNNVTAATGTTTITPDVAGNQVTVTFTSFNTQLNTDLLKVYDGPDATTGILIGTYSGTTLPPVITASTLSGALTFVFTSNGSTVAAGWVASVTCAPAPACQKPILLTTSNVQSTTALFGWTQNANPDTSTPTQWEYVAVPCNSAAPTSSTVGTPANSNPFLVTGLTPSTCYDLYVRANCGSGSYSAWVGPKSISTPASCVVPTTLTASSVLSTSAVLSWTQPQNPDGTTASSWKVIALPCNSAAPTSSTNGWVSAPTNPFTLTGLSALTCYDFYVMAVCSSTDSSLPSVKATATTQALPPVCGGQFVNVQGTTAGTYPVNSDSTVTICPTNPGDQVTVTFTSFSTETNYDGLYVYDGNSVTDPQIASTNGPGTSTILSTPGAFWGSTLPGPFTSSSPTGCLTFRFRSDGSISTGGWVANITCSPGPTCPKVTNVVATGVTSTTATVSWTENGPATQWEIIVTPSPSTAPNVASTGIIVGSNPATLNNLTQGVFYDIYVRPICSATDIGLWTNATSLYITPPLPTCAGVDVTTSTSLPGVINVCPNSCVNLNASYTNNYTTDSYVVNTIPYAPLYPYTGGTPVSVNIDDKWSGDIPLPFKFCFYGNTYNAINIGSNGVVTFNSQAQGSTCPWAFTATIPNTAFPIRNAIYGVYQDIDPSITTSPAQPLINYQVLGTAPCRAMVISFSKVALFGSSCTAFPPQTSQIVLYETSNMIDVNIKNRTSCTGWNSGSGVIGIQNAAGTNAVVPPGRNTGTWSATNESWRFTPSGPSNVNFAWLQEGSVLSNNTSVTVCPTVNTNMTAQATYTACDGTTVVKTQNVLLNITNTIPTFTQIGPLCQNSVAPLLPATSTNTPTPITGTWNPSTIDTSIVGPTVYTFTPDAGQCASTVQMTIIINPQTITTFVNPGEICVGTTAPILLTTSTNAPTPITGNWIPPLVSNTTSGTYVFTPDAGQCATPVTLNITVNPNCNFGSYASAVWLQNCSTSNFFNTTGSGANLIGPAANVFAGTHLGTYIQNSGSLLLKGAEVKTFKSLTSNVCSANLHYRIYPQLGTPGVFQSMNLPWYSDCGAGTFNNGGDPCNPNDQKWQKVLPNTLYPAESPIDLTTFIPGNYVVQVYYDITGSSASISACDETVLIDNAGAYYTSTFTIQSQPSYTYTNPTTCGGVDGTITISGLAPNTSYDIAYEQDLNPIGPMTMTSNASGEILLDVLVAGTYSNFVLSINGCSYPNNTPIILEDPAIPTVSVNSAIVCVGQSVVMTATPGTAGTYSYSWTVPGGSAPGDVASFSATVPGTYSVIITNTLTGCTSSSASGTLSNSTLIVPTFNTIAPFCSGATAPILPTISTNLPTAVTGTWAPPIVSNTSSAAYVFTPDVGQCSQPLTINVTVNSVPDPVANIVTQPTCVTPTGTVEITSPISSLGTALPTDLFISEATDSNSGSLSYIELYNGTGAPINLANYSIKTANNGGAYGFTLPLNSVNLANGATYVIALGNDGSCSSTLGGDGSLSAQSNGSGSVNFSANGNDHFGLFNGTTLIDSWGTFGSNNWAPASIGTEGADFRRKNNISPLPNPTYNNNDWDVLDYAGSAICANNDYSNIGLYSLTTTTVNYQYSVDGGTYQSNPVFTGLTPGAHTFTVLDTATGCTNTVSVTLNQPVLNPSVTTFTYTTPVCTNVSPTLVPNTSAAGFTPNGTYTVTSGTGLVINPSTGVIDLVNSASGTYVINYAVLDNPAGCILAGNTSFTLVINALPAVTVNSPVVCAGSQATVTATPTPAGTYSYAWTVPVGATNPGDVASFTTTHAGVYSVIITNITTGCSSASASGTVTINALPTVTVNSPTVCQGTNAIVTATPTPSGTYTYVWTVPSGTNPGNVDHFTATVSGNYGVTITNTTTGCTSASATSAVTINANPSVSVSGDTVCQGALATISASATPSGTYNYVWTVPSGTNPGNVASFTTAIAGTYSVIATNATTGCSSSSQSGVATITPAFDFVITDGCVNNNFLLEVVPTGSSFDVNTATVNWQYNGTPVSPSGTTFDVTAYLNSTTIVEQLPLTFTAVVLSDNCQQTHSIVLDRIYCDIQKGISPNNDGKNDYFDLRLMNVQQLSIFNRYGTKVYSKSDYSNEWIGQSDAGNELPDGTYYYVIEFKNNQASKTGWIYINRETK